MNVVQCAMCEHFRRDVKDANVCAAYPDGIPDAITGGEVDHTKPYPGDNGIRFQLLPSLNLTNVRQ